ncbi:MAG: hypothetical protein RLY97_374 [Pseudomonadota bacterium]|jgi:hypothetical protein
MQTEMLAPAAALVLWSMIVQLWMTITRFSGFKDKGIELSKVPPGGRGSGLDGVLPDKTMWKSHNFTHLMEQPTIFYPVVIILAQVGGGIWDLRLAWAYVALRIIHSVYQSTVNIIKNRAMLFFAMSACLLLLAIHAVILTLFAA